jgi:hypothetical protein
MEAAFFAAPHASPGVAKYICRRLLSFEGGRLERRQMFSISYFIFSAEGLRFTNRCKVAAKFASVIKQYQFENYLLFQTARAAEAVDDVMTLLAGLRFLSGIEVMEICGAIVDALWARIETLHEQAREPLTSLFDQTIDYLTKEQQNAMDEYKRAGHSKPRGTPYFVRKYILQSFCNYVLHRENDAVKAFQLFDCYDWYRSRTRIDIDSRVSGEMRREANLAFGRWYRRSEQWGRRPAAESYRALLRSLTDKAIGGDRESGEAAFFLLRHSAMPHEIVSENVDRQVRAAVVDSAFAEIYATLKSRRELGRFFERYPITVASEAGGSVRT